MKKNTVRLTFDLPKSLLKILKIEAAKSGVSMKSYIVSFLMDQFEHEEKIDCDDELFQKELELMMKNDAKLLKILSDK